jgi:phospholipase/lecithinase/hemolysin
MDAALVSLLFSVVLAVAAHAPAAAAATPRAFFVFGDSLVDNGNNNYLLTTARADAPPYGIDYPSHRATGRFSNGLNIPDIISNASHAISHIALHASSRQKINMPCLYCTDAVIWLLQASTSGPSLRCRT